MNLITAVVVFAALSCPVRLILETDPQTVAARVTMRGMDGDVPVAEQVSSSWTTASCFVHHGRATASLEVQ
jgi:hypothetical protein